MPYLFNDPSEEDQKNMQAGAGSAGPGQQAPQLSKESGSSFGGSGASAIQGGSKADATPSSSGSFVNLQKYLDANADQSPANQIAGRIGNEAGKASGDLNSATNSFTTKAEGATTHYNKDLVDNSLKDPTAAANDPNQLGAFQKQLNASYGSGPKSLNDVSGYDPNEGANAQSLVDQTKSENGQFGLLQRYFGGPNQYSRGEQGLDQYLLQAAPGSPQALKSVQDKYGNIAQQYGNAQAAAQDLYGKDSAETKQAHDYAQAQYGGANTNLQNDVTTALGNAKTQQTTKYNDLNSALTGRTMSQSQLEKLGLNDSQYQHDGALRLYGLHPENYLGKAVDPTLGSVATKDQAARSAALAKLGGTTNTFLPDGSLAGTYTSDPTFNRSQFGQDLIGKEQAYQNDLKNTDNLVTDPFSGGTADPEIHTEPGAKMTLPEAIARLLPASEAYARNPEGSKYYVKDGSKELSQQYSHLQELLKARQIKDGYSDTLSSNGVAPTVPPPTDRFAPRPRRGGA